MAGPDQRPNQGDPRGYLPDPRQTVPPQSLGDALVDVVRYQGSVRAAKEVIADLRTLDGERIAAIAMATLTPFTTHESAVLSPFELEIATAVDWCITNGLLRRGSVLTGPIEFAQAMALVRDHYLSDPDLLIGQRSSSQ